jgi:Leucine-rich repeat (LRR) protein
MKNLVIENCPKLETLNVRKNDLTSLEFMVNLRNLTELEIEGNTELDEILKPYGGD